MWKTIINPETGRKVNINGTIGIKVLNNFITQSQTGGADCGQCYHRHFKWSCNDNDRVRPPFFNSKGRTRNLQRANLAAYKTVQLQQLKTFQQHAAAGNWNSIHHAHFDWYCFPIEDGSQDQYNVLADDVAEMSADDEWLERYLETIEIVARAWGWDLQASRPVSPITGRGMGWTGWDIRLSKMIRSTWIFCQKEAMESLQAFARFIKPDRGLRYGSIDLDEVFDMSLDPIVVTKKPKKAPKKSKPTPKAKKSKPTPKAKKSKPTPKAKKSKPTPKAKKSKPTPKAKKSKPTPKAKKSKNPCDQLKKKSVPKCSDKAECEWIKSKGCFLKTDT